MGPFYKVMKQILISTNPLTRWQKQMAIFVKHSQYLLMLLIQHQNVLESSCADVLRCHEHKVSESDQFLGSGTRRQKQNIEQQTILKRYLSVKNKELIHVYWYVRTGQVFDIFSTGFFMTPAATDQLNKRTVEGRIVNLLLQLHQLL